MKQYSRISTALLFLIGALSSCQPLLAAQNQALLPMPKLQFLGNTGSPLSGGKLYTCLPHTSCGPGSGTFKATYSDSAGTTPNTNPIILDSAGRGSIYGNTSYKVALYDSIGNLIYSQDNVSAGSGGGGGGPITIAPWGSPRTADYYCESVSDCNTINTVIAANVQTGGGIWDTPKGVLIQLTEGTFPITTDILVSSGVTLQGRGKESTFIKNSTSNTINGISITPGATGRDIVIRDLAVLGKSTATTGAGISMVSTNADTTTSFRISNVNINGFYNSVAFKDTTVATIDQVRANVPVNYGFVSTGWADGVNMRSAYASGAGSDGYKLSMSYSTLISCASDNNGGAGYSIYKSSSSYPPTNVSLVNCGAENNTGASYSLDSDITTTLDNCRSINGLTSITANGSANLLVQNGYFNTTVSKAGYNFNFNSVSRIRFDNVLSSGFSTGSFTGTDAAGFAYPSSPQMTILGLNSSGVNIGQAPGSEPFGLTVYSATDMMKLSRKSVASWWQGINSSGNYQFRFGTNPSFVIGQAAADNTLVLTGTGVNLAGAAKFTLPISSSAAGTSSLFLDSADDSLRYKTSAGAVYDVLVSTTPTFSYMTLSSSAAEMQRWIRPGIADYRVQIDNSSNWTLYKPDTLAHSVVVASDARDVALKATPYGVATTGGYQFLADAAASSMPTKSIYVDSTDHLLKFKTGGGAVRSVAPFAGTTSSVGGSPLTAGSCDTISYTLTGVTTDMVVVASPVTYPGDGIYWRAFIPSGDTVAVKVCAAVDVTPVASTYNIRVWQ